MKITNKQNLPDAIVKALTSDYKYKPCQFSVTTILQGIKSFLLMKRHSDEIEMDASDGINMVFGTAVHNIFEGKESDEELAEEYMKVKVTDLYSVSGRLDLYNIETEELTDYKTCSIWKIKYKDYEDWRKQLLIYAWMLRKQGFEVKKAKITALIKDWKKNELRVANLKGEYYPPSAIINVPFEFNDHDYEEIEKWLVDRFNRIANEERLSDDAITPCSEEERWSTGDKWAVMNGSNKRAIRVFDNFDDAEEFANTNKNYRVEFRQGEDKKCLDYCNACHFCNYWKEHYGKEKKEED